MNYISINELMNKVTRHPLMSDIPFETVIDYTLDFMRITGMPRLFMEKVDTIDIKEYRGELPCDFYEMILVRPITECGKAGHAMRYSTDNFHYSKDRHRMTDLTYKILGNYIFPSDIECGKLEIAYLALPVDNDGYPSIPDNSSYTRALELFIKKNWFTILFDLGKITLLSMAKADLDYAWAVGQCQTEMVRPSIDQMQSISNMWNSLFDRAGNHSHGFVREGMLEHLINH